MTTPAWRRQDIRLRHHIILSHRKLSLDLLQVEAPAAPRPFWGATRAFCRGPVCDRPHSASGSPVGPGAVARGVFASVDEFSLIARPESRA